MAPRSNLATAQPSTARHQAKPISAKRGESRIPQPQVLRIMKRHVAGESARKISREEGRDRATIAKIVKSEDMAALVRSLREQLYGMAGQALRTVLEGMTDRKNELLAYKLLADIGVIPSAEERVRLQSAPVVNEPMQRFKEQLARIVAIQLERRDTYGTPFPELDEDIEKAGMKINPETGNLVEAAENPPPFEEVEDAIGEKLLPLKNLAGTKEEKK